MKEQTLKEKFDLRKSTTNITQDKTQTRATIPKRFVDEFEVTKKDKIQWDNKGGKLKGELKKQ